MLEGENQYTCDRCECKRDAFKGIKLTKAPTILTIGLKRFDFDLATLTRVPPHVRGDSARRASSGGCPVTPPPTGYTALGGSGRAARGCGATVSVCPCEVREV